jgi:hypothetical protein
MITYFFIINYHLLLIIKIARAVPSIKLKIKTNIAFPPKITLDFFGGLPV